MSKVAIAGPNGNLGPSVIHHLSKAGFELTLLTRDPKMAAETFPHPIRCEMADYSSADQLTAILKSVKPDALVILINREQLEPQLKLIDAAIAARVPHLIPSCFGLDLSDPRVRELPVTQSKLAMEDYLLRKARECHFTWTGINTSLFFDWALEKRALPINIHANGKPSVIFDGGDTVFSSTTLDRIGEAVAQCLIQKDKVTNRYVYVHSGIMTQNKLLQYARELAPHREFAITPMQTEKLMEQGWEKWQAGNRSVGVMSMFLPRITWGWGLARFSGEDNEILGLPQWSESDIKEYLRRYLGD
ncbi:hypothetical protein M433DRAFT_160044 [Acidomyces richmondensis BFW]|nr:MAG: hypothetical protein FE78DRAFT_89541 [Acidomyces sp. 'richmondensis']KYG40698.1 hypothetical protein M433DRAFT_160044 [Acidomyces richmondensis BFW]